MKNIEHSFELLGEQVEIVTNSAGSFLYVSFGDTVIEDSSGDRVDWGTSLIGLHGSVLEKATNKLLEERAKSAIAEFIHYAAEELSSL